MTDESYPDDLLYHPEHDWLRGDGSEAEFGITWFAQNVMGEIVYFDPPSLGALVTGGASYGELESVKAVSDVVAPASGTIVAVNDALGSTPESINADPYGAGWLVRVRLTEPAEMESLMGADAYRRFVMGLSSEGGAG